MLVCCEHALATGGPHGTNAVNLSDSYLSELSSRQLSDLANRPGRVGGYWVNSNDWFYFAGDTEALNDFLRRYAKLTETPLILVLHPGKAPAESCVGDLFEQPYDWKLDSMYAGCTREKAWFEKPGGGQWRRVAIVQTWLGGNVRLDRLEVPTDIEVRPGGEIEAFIEEHDRKRAEGSEASWGKPVDGVQCRLLPESSTWRAGQTPQLQADLRNGGRSEVNLGLAPENWEVQYDGVWYRSLGSLRNRGVVELLRLKPGAQNNGISLMLEERWDWRSKDKNLALVFRPGRHTLRAAFQVRGVSAPVVSNPVEIEIVADEPAAGADETAWGPATEGVQCRLRPEMSTWQAGQRPVIQADLRNRGKRDLAFSLNPISWDIEYDGVWYHAPDATGRRVLSSLEQSGDENGARETIFDPATIQVKRGDTTIPAWRLFHAEDAENVRKSGRRGSVSWSPVVF